MLLSLLTVKEPSVIELLRGTHNPFAPALRILFAAESGSRAWGFASPDGDYDVRFIYAHPQDWYLSIAEERDVIERPLDHRLVDLSGWDLRKALRLFVKSNPAFYEWLTSPIVYLDDGAFAPAARELLERHADLDILAHAYHSIASGQLSGDRDADIKLKRYFYAIRPLLALQWINERQSLPPMNLRSPRLSADGCLHRHASRGCHRRQARQSQPYNGAVIVGYRGAEPSARHRG